MMTMKLLYYDDVTPLDYQPPGFATGEQEDFIHMDEVVNIAVGDVATVRMCIVLFLVMYPLNTSCDYFLPLVLAADQKPFHL
jgi:hypothetical protein